MDHLNATEVEPDYVHSAGNSTTINVSSNAKPNFFILLQFLWYTLQQHNSSIKQYPEISDKFIYKPQANDASWEDFTRTIHMVMYKNQNDSLSNFQHDWSQFLLHFKNTITQPPNTTYYIDEPNGNNISPENRYTPFCSDTQMRLCDEIDPSTFSADDIQTRLSVSFWFDGILQFVVGGIGIVFNLMAIPILCGLIMKSIFNKLLICLLALHTAYICTGIMTDAIWPPWITENSPAASSTWFILLFSFVLHPLKQFLLFSSIFITVLMSRQRYMAIRHPIEYRNSNQRINPWAPALRSLVAVMSLSALLTSPIFIETKVVSFEKGAFVDVNATHFQYELQTGINLELREEFRFDWHYIIWYQNLTKLVASLLLPFSLLTYWSYMTLAVIRRRRRLRNRPYLPFKRNSSRSGDVDVNSDELHPNPVSPEAAVVNLNAGAVVTNSRSNSSSNIAKREEARKARILFTIAFFFIICNVPRIIVNLEEFVSIAPFYWKKYTSSAGNEQSDIKGKESCSSWCYSPPFWAVILESISKFLLILNASVCCFVYCVICRTFRSELAAKFNKIVRFVVKIIK